MKSIEKLQKLKDILQELNSVVVAFSGGVDSTLLLKVAADVLKENVIAVICRSASFPESEFNNIIKIPDQLGVKCSVIKTNELDNINYKSNPPDRCYHCKKEILSSLIEFAKENGYAYVIEGSNYDDLKDYRPGKRALDEMKIRSPLMEAGLSKDEIRELSHSMKLPTWDKPSMPCLSSRIPYGIEITEDILKMIDRAEEYLRGLGFKQLRVRYHGDLARIEVPKKDIKIILKSDVSEKIFNEFKKLGFVYVTVDVTGYRMGSLNDMIKDG